MTDAGEWQGAVGRVWAAEWRRTDRAFAELTARLLERIEAEPGRAILDIGCGAGELSLALAEARPGAAVLGIDISPELVAVAEAKALGYDNCGFAMADAARWRPGEAPPPDLLVSRHGVMFFADPGAAFAHLGAVAAPSARLVFSCFRDAFENPWASELAAVAAQPGAAPADPQAPGPFAFADRKRVETILCAAGWREIAFEAADFVYCAGEGADPVGDALAYLSRIGPAAAALRALPEHDRGAVRARIRDVLARRRDGPFVTFPAAAWIVTARR